MKVLLSFTFFLCISFHAKAQWVTIPDNEFVAFLTADYPTCMSGNQMDTTCTDIVNENLLMISSSYNIVDLEGLQYFDNVESITVGNNTVETFPVLHPPLWDLKLYGNQIVSVPQLPNSITELYLDNNPINTVTNWPSSCINLKFSGVMTTVPVFPNSLITIDRSDTPNLPSDFPLPANLETLKMWSSMATDLPAFPNSLTILLLEDNPGVILPDTLPPNLVQFEANSCDLQSLPVLNSQLEWLEVENNTLNYIPPLPNPLTQLRLNNNPLVELPYLNNATWIQIIDCGMTCLPPLPDGITISCTGNNFTCVPNQNSTTALNPVLNSLPLCSSNNTFGCPTSTVISGVILCDVDDDCVINSNDGHVSNVPVVLLDDNMNQIAATSTNLSGAYSFNITNTTADYTVKVDTTLVFNNISCDPPGDDTLISNSVTDTLHENIRFLLDCPDNYDLGFVSANVVGSSFPGECHNIYIYVLDYFANFNNLCGSNPSADVEIELSGPISGITNQSVFPANINGQVITYTIPSSNLYYNPQIWLEVCVDTSAQGTDQICLTGSVLPSVNDLDPLNNQISLCYNVFNSYDPNNKIVNPDEVAPDYNDWLYYTINFQNTGTAPAHNIRLVDTLSNMLDIGTFQPLGYSHGCNYVISSSGVLTVYYNNIMLPDSASNEPESKGYFSFRMKPSALYPDGTVIPNTVGIYFDPPVITNTATVTYDEDLLTAGENLNKEVLIYPNPTNGQLNFKVDFDEAYTIKIYSIDGRMIHDQIYSGYHQIVDLDERNGIYLVEIASGNKVINRSKVILQH